MIWLTHVFTFFMCEKIEQKHHKNKTKSPEKHNKRHKKRIRASKSHRKSLGVFEGRSQRPRWAKRFWGPRGNEENRTKTRKTKPKTNRNESKTRNEYETNLESKRPKKQKFQKEYERWKKSKGKVGKVTKVTKVGNVTKK